MTQQTICPNCNASLSLTEIFKEQCNRCGEVFYNLPEESDEDFDFQPCDGCDLPDACECFGCAVKAGLKLPDGIM